MIKLTRGTARTPTAIYHTFRHSFFNEILKAGILRCDISDHFPIFHFIRLINLITENETKFVSKRIVNDKAKSGFNYSFCEYD